MGGGVADDDPAIDGGAGIVDGDGGAHQDMMGGGVADDDPAIDGGAGIVDGDGGAHQDMMGGGVADDDPAIDGGVNGGLSMVGVRGGTIDLENATLEERAAIDVVDAAIREVAISTVEASQIQTQLLLATFQRIFAVPGRRLEDTRPLSTRFNVTNRRSGSRQVADLNYGGSYEENTGLSSAWMTGLGGTGRRNSGSVDSRQNFGGFAIGVEGLLRPDLLGGVYAGTLISDQKVSGGWDLESRGGFIGLYGRMESGDILVDMDVGVASNRYDRRRPVGGGTIARGDYDGWLFGTGLGVGRRFDLGPGQSFSPFIRVRYSGSYDDSFTESGVDNPVTTDGVFSHLFEGRLEGIYRHDLVLENGPGTCGSHPGRPGPSRFGQ